MLVANFIFRPVALILRVCTMTLFKYSISRLALLNGIRKIEP